jgi:hypothetical protein
MYPECRHIKTDGKKCYAPALGRSHWCYFHDRLHRKTATRRPPKAPAETHTLDYGAIPVTQPASGAETELALPFLEDPGAIQLALTGILQALAANQLDPRRAGLLLYGLQIASQNSRHDFVSMDPVRAVTYSADGSPLGPAEQGWDVEDFADDEDEDSEGQED